MNATKLKFGIVGTGMMGREHMRNVALVPEAKVVAMADPFPGSLERARRYCDERTRQYTSHQEMMAAEELDAVIVATPNHTHAAIVGDLMARPVALLVEKPLCTTVADAKELTAAASRRRHLFWTGLEYRYMPPVTELIRRTHDGTAGRIHMVSIREHRFPFLDKVGNWNRFNRNTGGTLVEKCCHFFDLMRHILQDEPVRVFASGGQSVNHLDEEYAGERPDILDNAYCIVDFEGGARASLDLCMFAEGSEEQEEIAIVGDVGKLEVKIPSARLSWSPRDRKGATTDVIETPAEALKAGTHHGATYFQLLDFVAAMINGAPATVSAFDGLRSVEMGAAAQKSIEEGGPVALSS